MNKKVFISTALCLSMMIGSLTGISANPFTVRAGSPEQVLPPEENDPGYERLSGATQPAAEENIAKADTDTGDSSGFLQSNSALSGLKGLSSSTSSYTGKTYTHASDFDGMNIYNGIDVSYHQGTIDWNKVKAAGIDYAILRLGYRGYSNGTLVTDTKFTTYINDAIAVGMPLGVYFWTEAVTVEEAVEEAQYVVDKLAPYKSSITMPVTIDWELNSNSRHAGLSKATNTAICTAFCDVIASNGYTPMIYANISDLNTNLDGEALSQKYEIWVARYNNIVNNSTAQFYGKYCMWQYSSTGAVNGINGNVDMNFWYTSSTIASPSFTHGATPSAISTSTDVEKLEAIDGLTASSASKKITLSWETVDQADGYQIYRRDTYNGSYKKVANVTNGSTSRWSNTGLSKKHEYYYKIRAYHKNAEDTVYSSYSKITAATKSASQVGLARKSIVLFKKPASKAKKLMTVPKGTPLEYVGVTYLKNGKTFHHYRYYTTAKTYDAYCKTKASLTNYTQGNTTAKLNLRKTAGVSGKLAASIPKNTAIPLLGTKKVNGATWYKTCFSTKKKVVITGYVAGSYIKK